MSSVFPANPESFIPLQPCSHFLINQPASILLMLLRWQVCWQIWIAALVRLIMSDVAGWNVGCSCWKWAENPAFIAGCAISIQCKAMKEEQHRWYICFRPWSRVGVVWKISRYWSRWYSIPCIKIWPLTLLVVTLKVSSRLILGEQRWWRTD